ncbi:MAG: hypothetical protein Q9209_004719 [Squamulea sp. 1 TL-2023]
MTVSRISCAFFAFAISVLLLSSRPYGRRDDADLNHISLHRSSLEVDPANITLNQSHDVALQFGRPDNTFNFTSSPNLVARAINYLLAICKGGQFWDDIQKAFNGQRPAGQNFGPNDFNNGWTGTQVQGGLGGLPPGWDPAFASFANGRVPNAAEVLNYQAAQNKGFRNSRGNPVENPTGARFHVLYVPSHNAMVARYVESPSNLLTSRQVPHGDIPNLIPPLHRLSDLSWYTYSQFSPNPVNLRYIGHHFITNRDTLAVIDRLLQAVYGANAQNIPWPGLRFDMNNDAAKALLATPNGVGIAYLMLDRAVVLGRRHPVVYIWNFNGFRCMLWDLVPVGS